MVKPAKTGHAGTLDPLATGVLLVCVGPATRLIENLQRLVKNYRATFLLGRHSETEDTDGEVVELDNPPEPTRAMIDEYVSAQRPRHSQLSALFQRLAFPRSIEG